MLTFALEFNSGDHFKAFKCVSQLHRFPHCKENSSISNEFLRLQSYHHTAFYARTLLHLRRLRRPRRESDTEQILEGLRRCTISMETRVVIWTTQNLSLRNELSPCNILEYRVTPTCLKIQDDQTSYFYQVDIYICLIQSNALDRSRNKLIVILTFQTIHCNNNSLLGYLYNKNIVLSIKCLCLE